MTSRRLSGRRLTTSLTRQARWFPKAPSNCRPTGRRSVSATSTSARFLPTRPKASNRSGQTSLAVCKALLHLVDQSRLGWKAILQLDVPGKVVFLLLHQLQDALHRRIAFAKRSVSAVILLHVLHV